MDRQTSLSMDWWMHELYRCTKAFIQTPTEDMQNRLTTLLSEYREIHETHARHEIHDEHEELMDYR